MSAPVSVSPEILVDRLFAATLGAIDLFSVYLGDRLGYYRALADGGPATSSDLAQRTGTAERYAREWLEQQAVTGFLAVDDLEVEATGRCYRLPDGFEAVLVDPESLLAMAPMAQIFAGCVKPLDQILTAYRSGGGVPFADYGPDLAEGQAGTTLPQFRHLLAQEWLPAMPDVHARLLGDPPARIADIGMGLGWSSIAIAKAYPKVLVDGFDLDATSVAAARANAEASGVADRVVFHQQDAAEAEFSGKYHLALAIECIHDMSDPVRVLDAMRQLVGSGGVALVVDEKVADRFTAPGDEVERMMYGWSIFHCLPVGMVEQPSNATGTVLRANMMRDYATRAGFASVDELAIKHDFFRFYRLNA